MSAGTAFWERWAEIDEARVVAARYPQNAPAVCETCHVVKGDVLFGCCAECFAEWKATQ